MSATAGNRTGRTIYPMPRPIAVRKVLVENLASKMPNSLFMQAIPVLIEQLAPHLRDEPLHRPPATDDGREDIPAVWIQILALASTGLTNDRIAARLGMPKDTVKGHIGRILARFSARDRTQAVAIAVRRGLIP